MVKIDPVLEIDYKIWARSQLDEWKQAIWEDIEALRDEFGVAYVTDVKLMVPATNEYGDPLRGEAAIDRRAGQAPRHAPLSPGLSRLQIIGGMSMKQPCYIGLEEARQVLAEMGVQFTTPDAARRRQGRAGTTQAAVLRRSYRAQAEDREGRSAERVFQEASRGTKKSETKLDIQLAKTCVSARFYCIIRYGRHKKKKRQQRDYVSGPIPKQGGEIRLRLQTFATLKEAREFRENSAARRKSGPLSTEIRTVEQGLQKWLDVCEKEGCNGRDPITKGTLQNYEYRAAVISAYKWTKQLHELTAPDVVEFRSWLLRNHSRVGGAEGTHDLHSMVLELMRRGIVAHDFASGIAVPVQLAI